MSKDEKTYLKITANSIIYAALSAGIYPLTYLYQSNHSLIASWDQFFLLILFFIALPIISFFAFAVLVKKIALLENYKLQVLTFLNLSFFSGLLIYSTYGLKKKILFIAFFIAFGIGFVLFKHIKKIIKFQFLLAIVGIMFLIPTLIKYISYNKDWLNQPDNIEAIKLKKTPNIYLIQPDGYIGLSELVQGNYSKDNTIFNTFLSDNNFKLYPNFRSNYFSTLSSNSSMFGMKHHYYNRSKDVSSELLFTRDIIVSENPVLSILKNNDYATSLILENSYLLTSRPKIGYDFCNIDYNDLSIVSTGFEIKKDVLNDLENAININKKGRHFYFVERIIPGHITTLKSVTEGKELEREKYFKRLDEANIWLMDVVNLINKNDPNGLIIIAADHGGFVGYDYSSQSHQKPKSRDNAFSMFSSLLAIKWPVASNDYQKDLNSSVNLFRTVFSFLSEDKSLLKNIQKDVSYLPVNEGAPLGVYEVIDEDNNAVFNELILD